MDYELEEHGLNIRVLRRELNAIIPFKSYPEKKQEKEEGSGSENGAGEGGERERETEKERKSVRTSELALPVLESVDYLKHLILD